MYMQTCVQGGTETVYMQTCVQGGTETVYMQTCVREELKKKAVYL